MAALHIKLWRELFDSYCLDKLQNSVVPSLVHDFKALLVVAVMSHINYAFSNAAANFLAGV